jgi:hypothetical protein
MRNNISNNNKKFQTNITPNRESFSSENSLPAGDQIKQNINFNNTIQINSNSNELHIKANHDNEHSISQAGQNLNQGNAQQQNARDFIKNMSYFDVNIKFNKYIRNFSFTSKNSIKISK